MALQTQIQTDFIPYSFYHWIPGIIAGVICVFFVYVARKHLTAAQNKKIALVLSLIPIFCVLFRMFMEYKMGNFDVKISLPFHLCRIIAVILPIIVYFQNRYWLGVMYFWILTGTLIALLTPDLKENFPHWSYLMYFTLHLSLIMVILFEVFVFRITIRSIDYINAIRVTLGYALFTIMINLLIGSNYFYTLHKPESSSFLDYMGPWPWYIISGTTLMAVLFLLVWVPFLVFDKNQK